MAAAAWKVYNKAKKYLQTGDIDLNGGAVVMRVHKASSNASTFTLSTMASVLVTASGGIVDASKTLASVTVSAGASAKVTRFDCADLVFTACAGAAFSCLYAVIGVSGGKAIGWSKLSSSAFNVTAGNTLTVAINVSGIWELTGGVT